MSDVIIVHRDTHHEDLPCKLTDDEYFERLKDLSGASEVERRRVLRHAEMVSAARDYKKDEVDAAIGRRLELSRVTATRIETRSVECKRVYDYGRGHVVTIRTDSGRVVNIRNMLDHELQPNRHLFDDEETMSVEELREAIEYWREHGGEDPPERDEEPESEPDRVETDEPDEADAESGEPDEADAESGELGPPELDE